jgi:hypothetical protein
MRYPTLFIVLFAFSESILYAQTTDQELIKDLRGEWLIMNGEGFRNFDGDPVNKIFFSIDASQFKGDFLYLGDDRPFGVFINQKLAAEKDHGHIKLSLDSLSALYSAQLSISIFQAGGVRSFSSRLLGPPSPAPSFDQYPYPRRGNFFLDFSLMSTLLLSVYLIFLLRTNPRLTVDYLNVFKLFSAQEREENVLTGRITSRVNLLFYFFCSLFCSLTLLVVFHLAKDLVPMANRFPVRSTAEGFFQWIKLSVIIAILLMLKLSLVLLFSSLFNLRDKAPIQYFNFIRALFLAAGLVAMINTLNFVWNGQSGSVDSVWLKMGAGLLVLSAGMVYLKLLTLTRYHFFHLFSYLCASEIIPLVILLKVLLY